MTKEEIGRILKESRVASGLTQAQVAETIGRPQNTISAWEMGRAQPDANTLFVLFDLFGRSVDEAFGFTKAPFDITSIERERIKKYRTLDRYGKELVDTVLNLESARAEDEKRPPEASPAQEPPAVTALPKTKRSSSGIIEIRVYDQPAAAGLGNYLDEPDYHLEQYPDGVIPDKADFGVIISGDSMEPKIHDGGTVFVQAAPSIDPGKIGIFVLNGQAYCKKLAVDRENRKVRLVSLNPKYADIVIGEADEIRTVGRVLGQWTTGHRQDLFGW